jgi:Xaa-Pro dipeptidase
MNEDTAALRGGDLSVHDAVRAIDVNRMRHYRYRRLQEKISDAGLAGALLFDPVNIRYALGLSNYAVYSLHSPTRAVFVPPSGRCVVFDHEPHSFEQINGTVDLIGDLRPLPIYHYFYAGSFGEEFAKRLADQVRDLSSASNGRVAIDRFEPVLSHALTESGVDVADAQQIVEQARAIKNKDEIACIIASISVAEEALAKMRAALVPGITENALCGILHETNIARGGEWHEYRLVCSGGRTNPWGQEATNRQVRAGELVIVDTGMIGPMGYFADVSRTFFCQPGEPTAEQKRLYQLAHQNIRHNTQLLRPGLPFREFSEQCWQLPEEFVSDRYPTPMHGTGMRGEWPMLAYPVDFDKRGVDGTFQPGMVLSVESYLGADDGVEGVKLEEQVLITDGGFQRLSTFPYESLMLT